MTDIGREFEADFSEDMGLTVVPGSGNQWHSKLDVHGRGARWSLKATTNLSYPLKVSEIQEAVMACVETGEIPLMAIRLAAGSWHDGPLNEDLIVMRKEDFKALAAGEYKLVTETKSDARRRSAHIPELLRGEEDE